MSWTDRLNPIFLQSLRQSLRGRIFTGLTMATLMATLAFSLVYIIVETEDGGSPSGQWFFVWIYGALSFAVHLFVPFTAFISLGNEWDENTFDLLVLSKLRPRNIVTGKFLSAMLLAGLWLCSFGPFLALSFLLPGTDLYAIGVIIFLTAISTASLTCISLFLSSIARGRVPRTMLMAFLAAQLAGFAMFAIAVALAILENPSDLRSDMGMQMMAGFVTTFVLIGGYSFAVACTRLAHPEENRSTALRVMTTLILLVGLWWITSLYRMSGMAGEILIWMGTVGLVVGALFSVLYATEDVRLGRRVALEVPKNRILALLSSPWQPGGSRGVLLHWIHMALILGGLSLALKVWPSALGGSATAGLASGAGSGLFAQYSPLWLLTIVYTWIYLGISPMLFRSRLEVLSWRIAARAFVFLLVFMGMLIPTLFSFVMTGADGESLKHIGNPFYVFPSIQDGVLGLEADTSRASGMFVVASIVAGLLALVHLPSVISGVREVLAASAKRRAHES